MTDSAEEAKTDIPTCIPACDALHWPAASWREFQKESLRNWTAPADVPAELSAALVPYGPIQHCGRVAVRTLDTLLDKSRASTILLLLTPRLHHHNKMILAHRPCWKFGDSELLFDGEVAQRIRTLLGTQLEEESDELSAEPSLLPILPLLASWPTTLKVVPILVPNGAGALEVGRSLGKLLITMPEVAVVASCRMTEYGPDFGFSPAGLGEPGAHWMGANDARLLHALRGLQAETLHEQALACRYTRGSGPLTITLATARLRDAWNGTVVEYTNSHRESLLDPAPVFTGGVGFAGVVF